MKIALQNKTAGGSIEPNIFVQTTEPTSKDGIWLQTNKTAEHYISDDNVFIGGTWSNAIDTTECPVSMGYAALTSLGTDLYLFNDVYNYKYDTLTDTYTRMAVTPYNVGGGGSVVTVGTDIFMVGGGSSSYMKYNYKYDTLTNTYTRMTDLPYMFRYGDAVSVGTDIYILGDDYYDYSSYYRYNYKYNTLTDTYTRMADIPYGFSVSSAVTVGTNIYILGGGGTSGSQTKYNYKYDTINNTYTRMADIPFQFYWGAAASVATDIYLFGGGGGTTTVYKYDTINNTYTKMTDIPFQFYAGCVASSLTNIYLMGNNANYGSNKVNRRFNTVSKSYETDNTVVIAQGRTYDIGYNIKLFNTPFEAEYQPLYGFADAWFYTTQDGLITDIPTYYGDGTQWVNFKNPPSNN